MTTTTKSLCVALALLALLCPALASAATVVVVWPAVTFPEGGSGNHYEVERQTNGGAFATIAPNVPPGTVSVTDPGLAAGATYGYRILACNVLGCGGPSPVVNANPSKPGTVGTATATWGPDQ